METSLTFVKKHDTWEAKYVSTGNSVIEIERVEPSPVIISANLEGMEPVIIGKYDNNYFPFAIFNIDVPQGIEITIITKTEVTNAKMLTE